MRGLTWRWGATSTMPVTCWLGRALAGHADEDLAPRLVVDTTPDNPLVGAGDDFENYPLPVGGDRELGPPTSRSRKRAT